MPISYVDYTATAGQTDFSVTFPYLEGAHVKLKINGVVSTAFTFNTSTNVLTLDSGATVSDNIRIFRETPGRTEAAATLLVDFQDGSVLTEADLDKVNKQLLYLTQESQETASDSLPIDFDGAYNAGDRRIKNLGNPTEDDDAVDKGYVDSLTLYGQASAVPQSWRLTGSDMSGLTGTVTATLTDPDPLQTVDSMFIVAVDGYLQRPGTDFTIVQNADETYTFTLILSTITLTNDTIISIQNFGVARNTADPSGFIMPGPAIPAVKAVADPSPTEDVLVVQNSGGTEVAAISHTGAITGSELTVTGDVTGDRLTIADIEPSNSDDELDVRGSLKVFNMTETDQLTIVGPSAGTDPVILFDDGIGEWSRGGIEIATSSSSTQPLFMMQRPQTTRPVPFTWSGLSDSVTAYEHWRVGRLPIGGAAGSPSSNYGVGAQYAAIHPHANISSSAFRDPTLSGNSFLVSYHVVYRVTLDGASDAQYVSPNATVCGFDDADYTNPRDVDPLSSGWPASQYLPTVDLRSTSSFAGELTLNNASGDLEGNQLRSRFTITPSLTGSDRTQRMTLSNSFYLQGLPSADYYALALWVNHNNEDTAYFHGFERAYLQIIELGP